MRACGVIFAESDAAERNFFTLRRPPAALPFGCRYRLLDFPLSCMARAGITHISVATEYAFNSLEEHIGSGKAWDLARYSGGIRLVTPYRYGRGGSFTGRLGALVYMLETLENTSAEHIVVADCDTVTNPCLTAMLAHHRTNGASVTLLAANEDVPQYARGLYLAADETGRIKEGRIGQAHIGDYFYLGTAIFRKRELLALLRNIASQTKGDILSAVFMPLLARGDAAVWCYREPYARVAEALTYYQSSMRLLSDSLLRYALTENPMRPILTSTRPTPSTVYGKAASAQNSLVAEGCRIEGRVENSLLFRGAVIGRDSLVRNSVLLGGCVVGEHSYIDTVCADKNVAVRDGVFLVGHPSMPLFIEQGKVI